MFEHYVSSFLWLSISLLNHPILQGRWFEKYKTQGVDMKGNISSYNGPWNFSRHVIQNQLLKTIFQPPLFLVALFVDLQGQRYRGSNQKEKSLSGKAFAHSSENAPLMCIHNGWDSRAPGHPIAPIVSITVVACLCVHACMCTVAGNATVGPLTDCIYISLFSEILFCN